VWRNEEAELSRSNRGDLGVFWLKDESLEESVILTACGFSARRDSLALLLALNQRVASRIEQDDPATASGVPQIYPDAKKLVTEDCIQIRSANCIC
jgi:hypothetical protein